jgi:LPPG:FO 2-phospho-L-lactate transferase
MSTGPTVVAVCGGVGGAKLALGLQHALPPGELAVLVNTGDDFDHLGLRICPDLDTVLYTLAGVANPEAGWGRSGETWQFMTEIARFGGDTWFQLGDRDLALHVERTRRLAAGETLAQIMQDAASRFGVPSRLWPMSDEPVRTILETAEGLLPFQDYFVRRRCEPRVSSIVFTGCERARARPEAVAALRSPSLRAVVLCPSNPWLSVDPILALPELRAALATATAPVVAVTPLIGGKAVKGPTAKLMAELGIETSTASVARHYAGLIDGYVVDEIDAGEAARIEARTLCAPTLMRTLEDRIRLAGHTLGFADVLRQAGLASGRALRRAS